MENSGRPAHFSHSKAWYAWYSWYSVPLEGCIHWGSIIYVGDPGFLTVKYWFSKLHRLRLVITVCIGFLPACTACTLSTQTSDLSIQLCNCVKLCKTVQLPSKFQFKATLHPRIAVLLQMQSTSLSPRLVFLQPRREQQWPLTFSSVFTKAT